MDPEPDVIQNEIEETRSALTEKLSALEGEIRGTVVEAKETVEDTICTVKETVQDTVQTVKQTFDLEYQTQRHPWVMLGGSVVAGFVVGRLLLGPRSSLAGTLAEPSTGGGFPAPRHNGNGFTAAPSKPSLLNRITDQFGDELREVKEIAIGAAMGVARDLIKRAIPVLAPQIEKVINSATSKMGGEPIQRPLV
jgi:ElaB/YqjD/DUF883 family membrane-anchored ribosome-binding protein